MSSIIRIPYAVVGTDLIQKIEEFNQERKLTSETWTEYARKKGGSSPVSLFARCVGIVFEERKKVPKNWYHPKWIDKYPKMKDVYVPRKFSSEWEELQALPHRHDAEYFSMQIFGYDPHQNCPPGQNSGYLVGYISYLHWDRHYVSIPTYYLQQHPVPDGLEEIPMSQWLEMCDELESGQ